ncbi:MAG TPA: acetylxylan esterase [archaeon]|nr:acetylxylan esterase [archaeon]
MITGQCRLILLAAACMIGLVPWRGFAQDDLRVFKSEAEQKAASLMLYNYLTDLARGHLDARQGEIASIKSAAGVKERQAVIRKRILGIIGTLPDRTALKAQITGRFEREDYSVENIIFQSRPDFYVTANLYLPSKGTKPYPAVLGTAGHTLEGKATGLYQNIWITLAKMGFVVLAFDPPGQGERLMYYVQDLGESLLKGAVIEHTMPGIQCLLTGSNVAGYFIWDGMRGIDYLLSRPEVDPKRIAVTGNSGGGMQTAYIAAVDNRVAAAVPSCYITSWRRLWETIGPQDAEQNMIPFVASRLDFADYVISFAPKPYLINAAIQDFFDILGTRETYAEARRIYELMGAGENLALFEWDDGHGYSLPRRQSCYTWLGKHFLGLDGPQKEPQLILEVERKLWATPTGQVSTSYNNAQTIGSLNAAFARKIMYALKRPGSVEDFESYRDDLLGKVRKQIRYERSNIPLNIQNRGFTHRAGMTVELITYDSEPGFTLPVLIFRPDSVQPDLPIVLYASDGSKASDAGGDIASLVAKGHVVLAPDMRGKGETARSIQARSDFAEWFSDDWQIAFMAFQVDKDLVGMQAADLVRAVDVIAALNGDRITQVVAVGKRSAGVPLLHAAALDNRISKVIIEEGLVSWRSVVEAKYHRLQLDNLVVGALRVYDLPALASTLAPRTLVLTNMADPMGHRLPPEEVAREYKLALDCYKALDRRGNILIGERQQGLDLAEAYAKALGH